MKLRTRLAALATAATVTIGAGAAAAFAQDDPGGAGGAGSGSERSAKTFDCSKADAARELAARLAANRADRIGILEDAKELFPERAAKIDAAIERINQRQAKADERLAKLAARCPAA